MPIVLIPGASGGQLRDQVRISVSGEPKDLARGTSTIAEEAVDQLQENEKLVAGESPLC